MFKNLNIKNKLILSAILSILGLLVMLILLNVSVNKITQLEEANVLVEKLNSDMLVLRKNEKDFILRKDIKYQSKFEKNHSVLIKHSKELIQHLNEQSLFTQSKGVKDFINIIQNYKISFLALIDKQKEIGLNPKDGLYGKLRDTVHIVQDTAKETRSDKLLLAVYDLRKQEKDFMLRRDLKYRDSFNNKIEKLYSKTFVNTREFLFSYKNDFNSLVEKEIEIGLDHKSGLQGIMRETVHSSEIILKQVSTNVYKTIEEVITFNKLLAAIITTVLIVSLILLTYLIASNILKSIKNFQRGLLSFFKYINNENNSIELLDDTKNDEIGIMAKVVNINIKSAKRNIEEDKILINDSISVLRDFEEGDLSQRITSKSSNKDLNQLTKLINSMGITMEKNINDVLDILNEYSNYNYINKIPETNLKKHLLQLTKGVNSLGGSITDMLVENKETGLTLNKSSKLLIKNMNVLNKNSNNTASSLEETSAAIEEITNTIRDNSKNAVQMSSYAELLIASAKNGSKLANDTSSVMLQINEKVSAINDAISVIDQISFQTNILSLNAAVEAATAGEAGKGFAVVAQEVRNLASRSAEAASEIKGLVLDANDKASEGKTTSQNMIDGYSELNQNITKTIELIKNIEGSSKEQLKSIEQINNAITQLDTQTQENVSISMNTHSIAEKTDQISREIVAIANDKEFKNKDNIKAK